MSNESRMNDLIRAYETAVVSDQSKIEKLENYKQKLKEVISEIEYIQGLYSDNIVSNNKKFEKYKIECEEDENFKYFWIGPLNIPRQTGLLKRLIQNIEEYSRRFRGSFKCW